MVSLHLLIAALCTADSASAVDRRVLEFLGPLAVEALAAPVSAQALKLTPTPANLQDEYSVYGISGVDETWPMSTQHSAPIARLLLNRKTYRFRSVQHCEFLPQSGLSFASDTHRVDFLLSFECSMLRVVVKESDGTVLFHKMGEFRENHRLLQRLLQGAMKPEPTPEPIDPEHHQDLEEAS